MFTDTSCLSTVVGVTSRPGFLNNISKSTGNPGETFHAKFQETTWKLQKRDV